VGRALHVVGIALGQAVPGLFYALSAATVAQVNLSVAVLVWLMSADAAEDRPGRARAGEMPLARHRRDYTGRDLQSRSTIGQLGALNRTRLGFGIRL
jgi:hypothetical protein